MMRVGSPTGVTFLAKSVSVEALREATKMKKGQISEVRNLQIGNFVCCQSLLSTAPSFISFIHSLLPQELCYQASPPLRHGQSCLLGMPLTEADAV